MNVLSLFAGIGGLDLGLERAGMTVIGQVEIDPFCRRVLAKHWPTVERHDDVRTTVDWWRSTVRPPLDLIAGGFPCQPVSVAGRGLAQADERWLWPEFANILRHLRPRYAILENVPGLLGRGVGDVLADLAALGYDTEWDCVPAAAVGAPHIRDRWFCLAHTNGERQPQQARVSDERRRWPSDGGNPRDVANSQGDGRRPWRPGDAAQVARGRQPGRGGVGAEDVADSAGSGSPRRPGGPGGRSGSAFRLEPQRLGDGRPWQRPVAREHWAVEPDVGRTLDGFSAWLDQCGRLDESHKLLLAYANAARSGAVETLRALRYDHGAHRGEWSPGGRGSLPASAVLFAVLRQLEARCRQAGQPLESEAASEVGMRVMRVDEVSPCPSLRRRPQQQRPSQSANSLHALSQLLARAAEQAWIAYRRSDAGATGWHWEDGYARVVHGIPGRVDRLKGLGNAVVPQVAEHIGRLVMSAAMA